ncbi:hypothetical protein TNCV_2938801 [Trichonephila clavipes]|nr:hypothetical protein TNCV_2938801 [Trichonephila clavipes]
MTDVTFGANWEASFATLKIHAPQVHSGNEPVLLKSLCLSVSLHNICLSAHKKQHSIFKLCTKERHRETMSRRKGLSPDEIANLLRELSENKWNGGELSCFNLDFDEDIRLSESDYKESEESRSH